ncbi:MAG TPA: tRNA pseudouridine(55) synthase TruB [Candidatus Paceibacterota bacterium]|nr:tRNA pseudouridine(55) synthase TruB [Candidatus Paceibacterota bacterium]
MEDDIVLIDKPKGMTSFGVIRRLRRELGIRKMGHAGTLDPLASGLMIIGIGKGTKKLASLIKLDKTYEAEIILGERRNTGDLEGEVVEERAVSDVPPEAIVSALSSMEGELLLPVPVFSAIKVDGKALYVRARKGQDVEVPIKPMKVFKASYERSVQQGDRVHVFATFSVGSGTYIRSLAEELGRRLGYPATLGNLRRTRVGDYDIRDSRALVDPARNKG